MTAQDATRPAAPFPTSASHRALALLLGIALLLCGHAASWAADDSLEEEALDIAEQGIEKIQQGLDKSRELLEEKRKQNQPRTAEDAQPTSDTVRPDQKATSAAAAADATSPTAAPDSITTRAATVVYPEATSRPLVLRVRLDDQVGPTMRFTVHRALDRAIDENADLLLLDLNTPGGRVDIMGHICNELIDAPMTTVAYINKDAFSAGAIIALACDNIFMSNGAKMGYATPFMMMPGSGPTTGEDPDVKEKMLRGVVKTAEATAEAKGHRKDIARAFVDRHEQIPGLIDGEKVLGLTAQEAVAQGVAISVVAHDSTIFKTLKLAKPTIIDFEITNRDKFAITLSSW
ncbi:hypothetical protein ACFL34_04095, partial [Candidatus Sumerlaeota bacterium]